MVKGVSMTGKICHSKHPLRPLTRSHPCYVTLPWRSPVAAKGDDDNSDTHRCKQQQREQLPKQVAHAGVTFNRNVEPG